MSKKILFHIKTPKYWALLDPCGQKTPALNMKPFKPKNYKGYDLVEINLDLKEFFQQMNDAGWKLTCNNARLKYQLQLWAHNLSKSKPCDFIITESNQREIMAKFALPNSVAFFQQKERLLKILIEKFNIRIQRYEDEIIEPAIELSDDNKKVEIYSIILKKMGYKFYPLKISLGRLKKMGDKQIFDFFKNKFSREIKSEIKLQERNLEFLGEIK